jgi:hypothetical protein
MSSSTITNMVSVTSPIGAPTGWSKAVQTLAVLPHNYVLNFHVETWGWAAVISMIADGSHYLIGIRPDGRPFIDYWDAVEEEYTILIELPDYAPIEADVQVAFREIRYGDSGSSIWQSLSLWMNERHIIKSSVEFFTVIGGTIKFGFAAPEGTTVEYTNIRIPELTTFADWTSLDPGEKPIGGLQRAIEGFYLRYFLRHNGQLRAWSPKATTSVKTYEQERMWDSSVQEDTRNIKTHIRQVGAYTQAEFLRRDLLKKYGHRFEEVNNPYLMTEEECYFQAERTIQRLEEEATQQSFSTEYHPLIEIEDHVILPEGERIISSRSVEYNTEEATESINSRAYIYGS